MNQAILKKQLGLKSTMKMRDYYSARVDEDRPDLRQEIQQYAEVHTGDIVCILTFEPPKKK